MERKWKTIDTIFTILFILFSIAFIFMMFLFSAFFIGDKHEVEEPITGKISEKGSYFGPTYKVITENHGLSYVSKKQFYNVEQEEVITGYQTNRVSFFTTSDIVYDGGMVIIIGLVLGAIVFSFGYYFYRRFFKKQQHEFTFNQWNHIPKKRVNISLIIYVIISMIFLLFIFTNLFHQFIPIGHTKIEANIIDEEIVKRYGRYATDEHYFHIAYSDKDNQEYLVRKRVNYHTYDTYKNRYGIPVHYQNSDPANVFIQLQSAEDHSRALMSFKTFAIIAILYSYSRIYERVKKHKRTTKNNPS